MPFVPSMSFTVGIQRDAPTYQNTQNATFRSSGDVTLVSMNRNFSGSDTDKFTLSDMPTYWKRVDIGPGDTLDLYYDDVGVVLLEADGLGGYTPSGYLLVWQHALKSITTNSDGDIVAWAMHVRLVKKKADNPLDMTVIYDPIINISGGAAGPGFSGWTFMLTCACFKKFRLDNDSYYYGFGWGNLYTYAGGVGTHLGFEGIGISEAWFIRNGYKFNIDDIDDPNDDPDNPPDEEEGGKGGHDKPDYPIPKPGLPSITAASAGFLTLYKLTPAEMSVFADDCMASDIWEAIKLLFANPLEFIVGCSIVPFTPPGSIVWKPKFGTVVFTHYYTRIDNQYVEINCGDLYIKPFGKNFLDYAPFTRITIYLPYIGFRELDVNEIMGKTINVTYHCDCLSGDCIAFISTSLAGEEGPQIPKVLATFNGNCACQVPFASQSFNSLIASSVNMLANVASSVVKGDLPAVSGSGVIGALEALGGDVQKSGSIGSSNGYMGVQIPYLIKHIPKDSIPSAYRALKGYPSNISGALGSFSGYAEIDNIDLTNISTGLGGIVATSAELEEIQTLLRGGVFI